MQWPKYLSILESDTSDGELLHKEPCLECTAILDDQCLWRILLKTHIRRARSCETLRIYRTDRTGES